MPQLHHTRFRPQLYATDQIGSIRQEHDFHAGNIMQRPHAVFEVLNIGNMIVGWQRKVPWRLPGSFSSRLNSSSKLSGMAVSFVSKKRTRPRTTGFREKYLYASGNTSPSVTSLTKRLATRLMKPIIPGSNLSIATSTIANDRTSLYLSFTRAIANEAISSAGFDEQPMNESR